MMLMTLTSSGSETCKGRSCQHNCSSSSEVTLLATLMCSNRGVCSPAEYFKQHNLEGLLDAAVKRCAEEMPDDPAKVTHMEVEEVGTITQVDVCS